MKTLITLLYLSVASYGAVVVDYFTPTGPTENLIARFDHSIEATTSQTYNGYVLLHMSGSGYNNPQETFDSFWFFQNSNDLNWQMRKQGLGIAFDGTTVLSGNQTLYDKEMGNNTDGTNISNSLWQIVWNSDVGNYSGLNRNGYPSYNPNHEYDIVLFINSPNERILNFGFLDGGLSDNSGQVQIALTPVTLIPEPSTLIFLFTSTLFFRRRR